MRQVRILVIHDDPDMVAALRLPLEAAGYEVLDASNNQEGLERIKEAAPALVILDAALETAPGLQVSLALRNPASDSPYGAYRRTPILMLTPSLTATALRCGPEEICLPVDDFVEKPLTPDVLLEKVAALIGK